MMVPAVVAVLIGVASFFLGLFLGNWEKRSSVILEIQLETEKERTRFLGNLVTHISQDLDRLRSGKVTDEELQNFCHGLQENPENYPTFCDGCDAWQRRHFGKCRTDELISQLSGGSGG